MEIECNNLHMFSWDKPCYARFSLADLGSVYQSTKSFLLIMCLFRKCHFQGLRSPKIRSLFIVNE